MYNHILQTNYNWCGDTFSAAKALSNASTPLLAISVLRRAQAAHHPRPSGAAAPAYIMSLNVQQDVHMASTSPTDPSTDASAEEPKYGGYSRFELELEVGPPPPAPPHVAVALRHWKLTETTGCCHSSSSLSRTRST